MIEFTVTEKENGKLLGEVLKLRGFSNRLVRKLKRTDGGITSAGSLITTVTKVWAGQAICLGDAEGSSLEPNGELPVEILFENNDLIVFNKPPLMPVHPSIKHRTDTLGNFFAFHCKGKTFRPVNRLDRDTSGCVIAAKNQYAAHFLQKNYEKKYYCIIKDIPFAGGRICAPIARERESIIKRCVRADGQYSATDWRIVSRRNGFSLIELFLETGRTHQIRVHFAYKGYPLLGDDMYGGDHLHIDRQALHCGEVTLVNPADRKKITVKAELPDDMKALMK